MLAAERPLSRLSMLDSFHPVHDKREEMQKRTTRLHAGLHNIHRVHGQPGAGARQPACAMRILSCQRPQTRLSSDGSVSASCEWLIAQG